MIDALRIKPEDRCDTPYKVVVVIRANVDEDQVEHINREVPFTESPGIQKDGLVANLLGKGQPDKEVWKAAERGEYRVLYVTEYIASGYGKDLLLKLHADKRLLLSCIAYDQWPEADFRMQS